MNGLESSQGGSPGESPLAQPESPSEDTQGLSRKKVVRVVRKVVRKVLPGEESGGSKGPSRVIKSPEPGKVEEKLPLRPLRPPSFSKPELKSATPQDELSVGLKSLMSRAKTKEHRSHARLPEKKEEAPCAKVAVVEGTLTDAKTSPEPKGLSVPLVKPARRKTSATDKGKVLAHQCSAL